MTQEVVIPHWVPRRARAAYFAAALVADERGEVIGGQATLRELLDIKNASHLCDSLGFLEEARLFVLVLSPFASIERRCEICGDAPTKLRGAKTCAQCLQGPVRRAWQADVMEIWRRGKIAGRTDSAIIQAAYNKVRRVDSEGVSHVIPRWGRAEEGQKGSGSGAGEGLVVAMVDMGLLSDDWLRVARLARGGNEGED